MAVEEHAQVEADKHRPLTPDELWEYGRLAFYLLYYQFVYELSRRELESSKPLTLDELRAMDGEPVWVNFPKCPEANRWMLVDTGRHCVYNGLLGDCDFEDCGKTWLAYRRKPKDGEVKER